VPRAVIIDAQVHAYERDHPGRPWTGKLAGPAEVTGDDMVAAMDEAGVDAALLVSPWTMYRFDPSYAIEVRSAHPDRFAIVAPIDPEGGDIEGELERLVSTPGAVGARLMLWPPIADGPGVDQVLSTAARHGLPLCVMCAGRLALMAELAARHPETRLVVDHLGLPQPTEPPLPPEPFTELGRLLALARYPNVWVKVTGAVTLSRRPFPYDDLWAPLAQLFDAFGFDRCMWGTDWTRTTAVVRYPEAVAAFRDTHRLSEDERAALMGGTLQRVFDWTPAAPSAPR
jgi:predicted TIM-barrel fold metal-dependent hydrolase